MEAAAAGGEEEEEEEEGEEEGEGEEEEEEEEDEWLLSSLRLYEALHTFELQAPTRVIEWALGNRVCVAGYGSSDRNEILQLLPPPTLQAKETQGLCPERDFKVECGGFSSRPVYSLKHVPDTRALPVAGKLKLLAQAAGTLELGYEKRAAGAADIVVVTRDPSLPHFLLVTSGPPDSSLHVWQVSGEDSDVIKPVSAIPAENSTGQAWAKIATISTKAPWVLHGSRVDSVRITEVESQKNVYVAASRSSEELSGVAFLDCNTLLLCCTRGQLGLADVRHPQSPVEAAAVPSAPRGERWCAGVGHGPPGSDLSSQPVACLSSGGHLVLADVRKISEPLASATCRVPSPGSGAEFLCLSWAPALEGCLAVSGFDGTVQVYDTRRWDRSGREAEPLFVHRGHAFGGPAGSAGPPRVTVHTWHPQKPRTLLSAASDGSLHVWDWVQPCGGCG